MDRPRRRVEVVAPATPADAKGLLLASIADNNPVLFLEHKRLYRSVTGPVAQGNAVVPIGRASVARAGSRATVVTYGGALPHAMTAADQLSEEGFDIEVIDLRSLIPWDVDTVISSVQRTARVLVLHEAPLTGGFGAEIAARIGEAAFDWLDAPVMRLGALDTPIPFARDIEKMHLPYARLVDSLRRLCTI